MTVNIKSYADLDTAFFSQEQLINSSKQENKNCKLTLNIWKDSCGIDIYSEIGRELNENFETALEAFVQYQFNRGISRSTISPQISRLKKIRNFYRSHIISQLPDNFYDRLRFLLKINAMTLTQLCNQLDGKISYNIAIRWGKDGCFPSLRQIPIIREIEAILGVKEETLTSSLPTKKVTLENLMKKSEYGNRLSDNQKKIYGVSTPDLDKEMDKYIEYKVAPIAPENLERNEMWTENSQGIVGTARLFRSVIRRIFGYACLPVNDDDPAMRGLGMNKTSITIGLLAKSDVVVPFVRYFLFERAGRKHTESHINIINIITPLLRKKTGYLYQKYDFAKKIGLNITPKKWHKLCIKTRKDLIRLKGKIERLRSSSSSSFQTTKDLATKKSEILRKSEPLSVTTKMIKDMLEDIPKLKHSPHQQSELFRDIVLIAIAQAAPLRRSMFAEMKLKKNLIRQENGLWTILFEVNDFKNRRFLDSEYQHTLGKSISLIIDKYIKIYRPIFKRAKMSEFVFLQLSPRKESCAFKLSPQAITRIVFLRSAQYIPDCGGFRMHFCRKIFATDFIKKHGRNGVDTAAAALNDNAQTVLKHYTHIINADYEDKINFHVDQNWNNIGLNKFLENGGLDQ